MSRIIDSLNKNFEKEKESIDSTQEKLLETFFGNTSEKEKTNKKINFLPAVITAAVLAFIIIFFSLVFNVKVSIKKDVKDMAQNLRSFVVPAKGLYLVKDGKLNKAFVKEISFLGDARKFSRLRNDIIVLINSKGSGWGSVSMKLSKPINMEGLDISYVANGQVGGERMSLTLIDDDNKIYRVRNNSSLSLTKNRKEYRVSLENAKKVLDVSRIREIQFEFGSLTSGSVPGTTIFLQDVVAKRIGS